ncbi:MAG: hypothetical protein ABI300_00110 [Rhodanobacter sp.]
MHATHWLIGCGLCIASIGVMAAPSADTQDMDAPAHTSADPGSVRDGGTTGSDVLSLGHDTSAHGGVESTPDTPASSSASGGSTPTRARASHVGWQSLLPGSIQ